MWANFKQLVYTGQGGSRQGTEDKGQIFYTERELYLQCEEKEANTGKGLENQRKDNLLNWILEEARESGRETLRGRLVLEMSCKSS